MTVEEVGKISAAEFQHLYSVRMILNVSNSWHNRHKLMLFSTLAASCYLDCLMPVATWTAFCLNVLWASMPLEE